MKTRRLELAPILVIWILGWIWATRSVIDGGGGWEAWLIGTSRVVGVTALVFILLLLLGAHATSSDTKENGHGSPTD